MSKKPAPPKSTGKQTTLLGFFSKAPGVAQASTPRQKRDEARPLPLTPLASSEFGEEETPVKSTARRNKKESTGYETPVTPDIAKNSDQMDVDSATGSLGSRKVSPRLKYPDFRNGVSLTMLSRQTTVTRNKHLRKVSRPIKFLTVGARSRKIITDDSDSDVFMPDAKEVADGDDDDDDIGSVSAEESEPSPSSVGTSPEPVRKSKPKSSLSKFTTSSPASSAPSTPKYTPKGSIGAFGKPTDKGERVKKFVETNKDRYSWLSDIRDKEGNRPGEEKYDPRTLYIPPGAWKTFSAFEKQYWEIKQNLWDTILFFQKGKFFELYENDATIGNQQFDLKMTDRTNMR